MPFEFTSYLNNSLYKNKGLTNFVNLGNSCYFNSVLASLVNCLGLTEYFLKNKHLRVIGPENREKPEFNYLTKYIELLVFYYVKNHTLSPKTLYNNTFSFVDTLTKNEQNDAHECLLGILNILHIANSVKLTPGPEDNKIHKHLVLANKEWLDNFKLDYSIINDMFFGQYIQKIKCNKCSTSSYKYDPFVNISLSFINKSVPTIDDLLLNFFKKQEVEMLCEAGCKEKSTMNKRLRILKLPNYLIIHLKRFTNDSKKIQKMVGFGSSLDMSPYTLLIDNKSVNYNLVSVINHSGSSNFGHYYTYNRTFDGDWVSINNNKTTKLQPTDVCTKEAYVLIYELDPI